MKTINLYNYKAEVVKIIDGDTLDVNVDLGFDIWHSIRIRLYGLDAPETRTTDVEEKSSGLKTKEFIKNWLDKNGYSIFIKTYRGKAEKYGRVLAEVYDSTCAEHLNDLLILEGLAKPYFGGHKE